MKRHCICTGSTFVAIWLISILVNTLCAQAQEIPYIQAFESNKIKFGDHRGQRCFFRDEKKIRIELDHISETNQSIWLWADSLDFTGFDLHLNKIGISVMRNKSDGITNIIKSSLNELTAFSVAYDFKLLIMDSEIRELNVERIPNVYIDTQSKIGKMSILSGSVVSFTNILIRESSTIDTDTVYIDNVHFQDLAILKLYFDLANKNTSNALHLCFNNQPDLEHYNFDYGLTNIYTQPFFLDMDSTKFYKDLIEMQRKYNYIDGMKRAEIEFDTYVLSHGNFFFRSIVLPIRIHWDYFGYNKELIFRNTLMLFSFFLLINLIFFVRVYEDVYPIESLQIYYDKIFPLSTHNPFEFIYKAFPYSFYFTAVVFFGLKMNLETLKLSFKGWALYLYIQYIVGLICLAYLVNFVITK